MFLFVPRGHAQLLSSSQFQNPQQWAERTAKEGSNACAAATPDAHLAAQGQATGGGMRARRAGEQIQSTSTT